MGFQLAFKALKEGKGVGGRPGKACDHLAAANAADFAGAGFDHRIADGDLTITCHGNGIALAHADDGGAPPAGKGALFAHGSLSFVSVVSTDMAGRRWQRKA